MKKMIIAFEGLPCAGKTIFIDKFKRKYSDFYCMPELFIDIKEDETSLSIRERYANAEILRKKRIDDVEQNVVLDRSFLSTLAFSYAKHKTTGDESDYIYNHKFFEETSQNIAIPDFVIVFVISPQESMLRRRKLVRDDTLSFWGNEVFLQNFLNYYYSKDFEKIVSRDRVYFIDTGKLNEDEVFNLTVNKINEICK